MPQEPKHLKYFREVYAQPPQAGASGGVPAAYLEELARVTGVPTGDLGFPVDAPLERAQLRAIGRDEQQDPLVLYALLMAWGEGDWEKFRGSLAEDSREILVEWISWLRGTHTTRLEAFLETKRRAYRIKGMGVSTFTRFLYFLRPEPDAYILDTHAAQSLYLLYPEAGIRLSRQGEPSMDTPPSAYLNYCVFVEQCAEEWGEEWTPEAVEEALSGSDPAWQKYLATHVRASLATLPKKTDRPANRLAELGMRIADYHTRNPEDLPLPSSEAVVTHGGAVYVKCRTKHGITWRYTVQKSKVHAEIFFLGKRKADYLALCEEYGASDGDFGDDLQGTPPDSKVNATLRKSVPEGSNRDRVHWDEIAEEAVQAMSFLFEKFGETLEGEKN